VSCAVQFDRCTTISHVYSAVMGSAPAPQRLQSGLWPHTLPRLPPLSPQPKIKLGSKSRLDEAVLEVKLSSQKQRTDLEHGQNL